MIPAPTLFAVIFLEGYVVLSTELLAIRLLIPFTGSGTDTVSIIIAAVLLPLAFGYYAGGRFKARRDRPNKTPATVRRKLVFNLLVAAAILTLGLSYAFLEWLFTFISQSAGIRNRIALTGLYAATFLSLPVYLLGQTVPLVSHYFSRQKLAVVAGRMLFFSTLGSFMGAVFATLVLMAFLGVHHTVSITIGCMAALVILLSKRKLSFPVLAVAALFAAALTLNSTFVMQSMNIVRNNHYNTVQVADYPDQGLRMLSINRSLASMAYIHSQEAAAEYVIFTENTFLRPLQAADEKKSILILGAGGFTMGRTDFKNDYVYVDIDSTLKEVAEEHFLGEQLAPNKRFVAMDARAYLAGVHETFDLIIIDLFRDPTSVPENLTTVEFFQEVRSHLKPGGIMAGNFFASPNFSDRYSRTLDRTIRKAFPVINRQVIQPYDSWAQNDNWGNVIYSAVNHADSGEDVYTDDKNTIMYDRPSATPY